MLTHTCSPTCAHHTYTCILIHTCSRTQQDNGSQTEGIFAGSLVPQPAVPAAQGGAGSGVWGLSICSAVSSMCAQDGLGSSAETN